MKVRKVLKHIDFLAKVQILEYNGKTEDVCFEGSVFDVPWKYAEMELDTDSNGEAIGVNDDGTLYIYVREK